jgi:hypothetical protein
MACFERSAVPDQAFPVFCNGLTRGKHSQRSFAACSSGTRNALAGLAWCTVLCCSYSSGLKYAPHALVRAAHRAVLRAVVLLHIAAFAACLQLDE